MKNPIKKRRHYNQGCISDTGISGKFKKENPENDNILTQAEAVLATTPSRWQTLTATIPDSIIDT